MGLQWFNVEKTLLDKPRGEHVHKLRFYKDYLHVLNV